MRELLDDAAEIWLNSFQLNPWWCRVGHDSSVKEMRRRTVFIAGIWWQCLTILRANLCWKLSRR
jgi:hypothetical protein